MFAIDLSQLIPQSALKFQHSTGAGELAMLKKFLSKYILEVIPSIMATVDRRLHRDALHQQQA